MSGANQQPPFAPTASDQQSGAGWDVFSQLLRTRQWEADGSQLLRPAAFHAWAGGCWTVPQERASAELGLLPIPGRDIQLLPHH